MFVSRGLVYDWVSEAKRRSVKAPPRGRRRIEKLGMEQRDPRGTQ